VGHGRLTGRIVYSYDDNDDSTGGIGMNLWIMSADGTNKEPLHRDPRKSDEYAEFSPDGRKITLISFVTTFAVHLMDANGRDKERITSLKHDNSFPRWSPNGSEIAFHSTRDGNQEAYIMNTDGSNPRNVSNIPDTDEYFPAWLPDGRISFMRIGGPESADLWIAEADGSGAVRIMRDVVGPHSWTKL
jgi:Tol biopolymer transport system component